MNCTKNVRQIIYLDRNVFLYWTGDIPFKFILILSLL